MAFATPIKCKSLESLFLQQYIENWALWQDFDSKSTKLPYSTDPIEWTMVQIVQTNGSNKWTMVGPINDHLNDCKYPNNLKLNNKLK